MYINYLKNAVLTILIALLRIKIIAFEKNPFLGHPVFTTEKSRVDEIVSKIWPKSKINIKSISKYCATN